MRGVALEGAPCCVTLQDGPVKTFVGKMTIALLDKEMLARELPDDSRDGCYPDDRQVSDGLPGDCRLAPNCPLAPPH